MVLIRHWPQSEESAYFLSSFASHVFDETSCLFYPRLGSLIGSVLESRPTTASIVARAASIPSVRVLVPHVTSLPKVIQLPLVGGGWVDQRVEYLGLPNQCFICKQVGHLVKFAVSQVSRFMHSPGSKHWQAVKRIFRYLSGTLHLGLFNPRGGSLPPDLHAFLDSDWAGCFDTRVSTSGFCFMLGSSRISWLSKKKPTVATSSCEAEYRAVFTAMVECVWLRCLMADLGVGQDTADTIYTDNQSALVVARNPVFHARTKHIEVHYHYVRERLSAGEISLAYVPTQDNLADLFTKALSREKLEAFRKALGLLPFVD
ncbi:hypothetical protein L7F22_005819 [Adiantum nelumboides]|nr:hypothetical protein [Adiantum nelumboides]